MFPATIKVGGRRFVLKILRVETRREDGRPQEVSIVNPEDVVELNPSGLVAFLVAFVDESCDRREPGSN